ncbi:hypothetical protein CVT24_010222 [Panaeolus cyanescens]|uniref:Uncharacterized protein n=1 Tax=Panaeolus cyanescens TaxID=181874 RepID=A0A409YPW0_9AGAR|nr:hypothetical protein CVT24_010222 [Panaeolus cyanescens]
MAPSNLIKIVPLVRPKSPPRPAEWESCSDIRLAPQSSKSALEKELDSYMKTSGPSFVPQARPNGQNMNTNCWANHNIDQQRSPLAGSHIPNSYYGPYRTPQPQYSYNTQPVRQNSIDSEYFKQNQEVCELFMKEFPQGPPPGMEQCNSDPWPTLAELDAILFPINLDFSMDQSMMSSPISEDAELEDPNLADPESLEFLSSLQQSWQKIQDEMMSETQS